MISFTNKVAPKKLFRRLFAFLSIIVLVLFFSLMSQNFLTWRNIITILFSVSITGLLALGMTFAIISGGADLSMGTVMTVSGVAMGKAMVSFNLAVPLAILIGIAMGALFGFVNGLLISRMKLEPFVATLGTMMIAKGLSLVITGGNVLYLTDYKGFEQISGGSIVSAIIPGATVPNAVVIFFIISILANLVLSMTVFGHYIYAIGSNAEAVEMSGIRVNNWLTAIYTTSGIFSGIAGVMMASRLVSAQPAIGTGYEMEAIAAVVIGGTPMGGGEGSILNTVLGAILLAVLLNGLRMLSVNQEWQTILTGVIIVVAVYIDMRRRSSL